MTLINCEGACCQKPRDRIEEQRMAGLQWSTKIVSPMCRKDSMRAHLIAPLPRKTLLFSFQNSVALRQDDRIMCIHFSNGVVPD